VSDTQELQQVREEIRDMYARYCFLVDHGRPDLFANEFTDDAILWLSDRGSYRGRGEIQAHVEKRTGKTLHLIHNVLIGDVDGDSATSFAYFQLLDPADAATIAYGTYDDALQHVSGRWHWHRKRVNYWYRSPAYAEVAAGMLRSDFGTELEGAPYYKDTLS
jgi:hypothetical protein